MTIAAQTNRISITGNGVTTHIACNFPFTAQTDLVVIETVIATGVQTVKTLTTDYTVTGTVDALGHYPNGGTVIMTTAPVSTVTITIYREVPTTQAVDPVQNDRLPVDSAIEAPLDKLTMIAIRLKEQIARSLHQPDGDSANVSTIPAKVVRASRYFGFDGDGNPTMMPTPTALLTPVAQIPESTIAGLPLAGAAGTLYKVTDGVRGLWMDTGTQWRPLNGGVANVKDFGAVGDGVTNDLAAITAAYAATPLVLFPEGTYNLGTITGATPTSLITIDGNAGHAAMYTLGRVKFICTTTVDEIHFLFKLTNATSVEIDHVEFEDAGFDITTTWRGAAGFFLYANDSSGPLRNITIGSIRATNMVNPIFVGGGVPATTNRVQRIHIGLLDCTDCYYGWNAQNNGDFVVIDLIRTDNVYRSCFVYGCTGLTATVHSENSRQSTGDIDITAYSTGYDTSGLDLTFVSRGADSTTYPINFVTIGNTRVTTISGVTIRVDIDDTACTQIAKWSDHTVSGGAENTGATNNVITGITLTGHINSSGSPTLFAIGSQPATIGKLNLQQDFLTGATASDFRQYFDLEEDFGSYTPAWYGSVSNPAIGNGTILGRYHRRGRLVTLWLRVLMGSTTTYGSGLWSFSLPNIRPTVVEGGAPNALGMCQISDTGTADSVGFSSISFDSPDYLVTAASLTGAICTATVPHTWADTDQLTLSISYQLEWP